jgi:hypothetical protein
VGGGNVNLESPFARGAARIELVRVAEEAWARADYLERLSEFENPDEFQFEPGDSHYLPSSRLLMPSRELLGHPRDPGFVLEPDDPRRNKATVAQWTGRRRTRHSSSGRCRN